MRKTNMILFFLLALFLFGLNSVIAQDFTITVGQDKIFTQFNIHETWFENCSTDPTGGLCALDPDVPTDQYAASQGSEAAVMVRAQPGSNGRAYARIGVSPSFNFGSYNPETAKALPVKITLNFDYTIAAEYFFGSSDGEFRIVPFSTSTEPWYDIIGHVRGTSGSKSVYDAIASYDTTFGKLYNGFSFLLKCHAHTGKNYSVPISFGSTNINIHSINIEFDHSGEKLDAFIDIDPNTLNLQSMGNFITCYISFSNADFVDLIDITSIKLIVNGNYFYPLEFPFEIIVREDGIKQLIVKFERDDIQNILTAGIVEFKVEGKLSTGQFFEGQDTIRAIKPIN